MTVTTRLAEAGDQESLVQLFQEIESHYWGEQAPPPEATARHVRDSILGGQGGCEIAVVLLDDEVLGLATFAVVYPAPGLSGQLYMKDLFTSDRARGRGIGLVLMRYLAELAQARGCSRFDWTAETGNPRALAFYDRIGARRITEKVYYRIEGDALSRFAGDRAKG